MPPEPINLDKIVLEDGVIPEQLTAQSIHQLYYHQSGKEFYWEGHEVINQTKMSVLVKGTFLAEDTGRKYSNGQPIFDFYFTPEASLTDYVRPELSLVPKQRKNIKFMYERLYRQNKELV